MGLEDVTSVRQVARRQRHATWPWPPPVTGGARAVITRTGDDPFGRFLHRALRGYRVDDRYVTAVPGLPTPVTFCEIFPPDDFPLYFYRWPTAPDLQIRASELDLAAIESAGVFWVTGTGLSEEPSRTATLEALAARAKRGITVLDLDYRPMFWASREAAREQVQRALPLGHRRGGQPGRVRHRGGRAGAAGRGRRAARLRGGAGRGQAGPQGRAGARRDAWRSRSRPCRSRWSTAWARATRSAARCATGCWPAGTRADHAVRERGRGHRRGPGGLLRRDAHGRRGRGGAGGPGRA